MPSMSKDKIKTPFVIYCEDCALNGNRDDKKKLREVYDAFSFQDKYKWILKAVSAAPEVSCVICFLFVFVTAMRTKYTNSWTKNNIVPLALGEHCNIPYKRWTTNIQGTNKTHSNGILAIRQRDA